MTLTLSGNILRVTGSATHDVPDIFAAQGGRVRQQGESDFSRVYEAHNLTLRIENGSRFIVNNSLIMNDNAHPKIEVQSGGVLQIGGQQTLNSFEANSLYQPVSLNLRRDTFGSGNQVFNEDASNLTVRDGGRVEIYGATLQFQEGNLWFEGGAELFIRDGRWYCDGQGNGTGNSLNRTRPRVLFFYNDRQSVIDIDGLTALSPNGEFNPMAFDQAPVPGIRNYRPSHCFYAAQFNGFAPAATDGTVIELDSQGNGVDILFNQAGVKTIFAYSIRGNVLNPATRQTDRHQPWAVLQYVDWTYSVSNAAGPTDAIAYLRDTDNGQRNFAYVSGDHKPEKEYVTLVPASGTATERLIIIVFDRSLNTDARTDVGQGSTSTGQGDPPADDRRPFVGWVRKFGHNQVPLRFSPDLASAQSFFLSQNRNVTLSQAAADAISGVSVTFHNTPVAWRSFNWSITIQISGSTTREEAWQYIHSQLTKSTAFAGRSSGASIHNLWPNFEQTESEEYYNETTESYDRKGVRIVTDTDNPFPGVTAMESDDESVYVPPTSATFTISNIVPGSELVLKIGTFILFKVDPTGSAAAYNYEYPGFDQSVDVFINQEGYEFFISRNILLGSVNQSLRAEQVVSSGYEP